MTTARGAIPIEPALDVYIQLSRASETIAATLQPALAAEGLTAGQLGVLEAIVSNGPMSLRSLGERLFRSAPNMTIVVDNLERGGLVRRARSETDRRVVLVEVTPEGLRRFRRTYPLYGRLIAQFIGVLSVGEQDRLSALCGRLREKPAAPKAASQRPRR